VPRYLPLRPANRHPRQVPKCAAERVRCNDFLFAIISNTTSKKRRDYVPCRHLFEGDLRKQSPGSKSVACNEALNQNRSEDSRESEERWEARERFEGAFGSFLHFYDRANSRNGYEFST
jgi:hypothetical protein